MRKDLRVCKFFGLEILLRKSNVPQHCCTNSCNEIVDCFNSRNFIKVKLDEIGKDNLILKKLANLYWKSFLGWSQDISNFYKPILLIFIMTKGKVVQFRRGRKTVHEKHFLIEVEATSTRQEATKFVGKEVIWKSPAGKIIKGKISSAHGNKGVVRAIFEKGLPGQAVTTKVEIK